MTSRFQVLDTAVRRKSLPARLGFVNMKSFAAALSTIAVLAAGSAFAQVGGYVVASQSATYTPLSGATDITPTSLDEGYAVVPLGFSFTYFGNAYTHLGVSANGVIFLLTSAQTASNSTPCDHGTSSNCYSNQNIPTSGTALSSTVMKTFIAPWWDDLEGQTGSSIRYTATSNEVDVEYSNWDYFSSGSGPFSFIVRFKDTNPNAGGNDQVQILYGSHAGSGGNVSVGVQDPSTLGIALLPCTNTTSHCSQANWPANTLYTIDQPVNPELGVTSVTVSNMTIGTGGDVSFNVSADLRNYGQNAASNFYWKAYLSKDKVYDTSDILAYDSSTGTATTVSGGATTTVTAAGSATAVPVGNYYVLVFADATNVITEGLEDNNTNTSATAYTVGADLVATSLTGAPSGTGPGLAVALTVNVSNPGTINATNVPYAIVLSTDKTFSANDFVAYTGTITLNANQTITNQAVNFTLPTNTPGGDQYFGIVLDHTSTVTEASEANNAAFASNVTTVTQADLVIDSVDLVDVNTGAPSRSAYMGDTRKIKVSARNIGGANATGFNVGVIISADANLSLQPVGADYDFQDDPTTAAGGYTLNISASGSYTFDVTIPSTSKLVGGTPLPTGDYYFFVKLDSFDEVTETKKDNNIKLIAGPIRLYSPSPDLATVKVQVPTATAVGEVVPVYRVFRNVGIQDSPTVSYRYFASVNDLVTDEDVPLEIVLPDGTTATSKDITLARGATDSDTDFVRLPANMAPGSYYIGAIIDPQNQITELDEVNNATGSTTTIQVAAPAMRITTSVLPDATVDRPFLYKFAITGAPGPSTWTATGLPAGLSVSADGTLTGTPTTAGITAFDVSASSGGRTAATRLVMRVLPNSSELAITTQNLPPIVNNSTVVYSAALAAAGGLKPYTWKVAAGALPNGITLKADGSLGGAPSGVPVGETKVTFQVTDSVGSRALQQVRVRVVAPGSVTIDTLLVPDGIINSEYITDLTAKAAVGGTLARPLTWSVAAGNLPEGIDLTTQQGDRGILQGTPYTPGTYLFTLQVEDANGRTDSADYVMRVFGVHWKISAPNVPAEIHPGDDVTINLSSGSGFPVTYSLYSGALPAGLTMNEQGVISGTVDADPTVSVGVYHVVITGQDKNGGEGMGAVTLQVTPRPAQQGCSVAGEKPTFGALMLGALALLGLLRRSKKAAFGAVAAVALFAAGSAHAQYSVFGPNSGTYTALTGANAGTVLPVSISSGTTVALPFPIKFYGTQYTSIGVAYNGYLEFTGADLTEYSNQKIPHTSSFYPSTGIFAWWDDLETSGGVVSTRLFGTAPNREFVIDWSNMGAFASSTSRFSFQVRLFESSSRIRLSYGPTTPSAASASVGIMGGLGVGLAGLSCAGTTSYCGTATFPANKDIDFALPPDMALSQLGGDDTGYANVSFRATAVMANVGGSNATLQKVKFYLSTNATLEPATDVLLAESTPTDVAAGQSKTVIGVGQVPPSTTPGNYWLLAKVDPDDLLLEPDETNNIAPPSPVVIGQPAPDLQVVQVATQAQTAVPGQSIQVSGTLFNGGNAPVSTATKYTWFLSDNSVASYSDFAFSPSGDLASIATGATANVGTSVVLPNDLPAGKYWIGLCVDYAPTANPSSTLKEISEVNNCATASTSFIVSSGALSVLTTSLPGASRFSPYSLHLDASGGNGTYAWSVTAGQLPSGMTLTSLGVLQGSPQQAGAFSFTAQVVSGSEMKTVDLSLQVVDSSIPLAVVDQDLPTGEFGKAYAGHLIAIGGKPPYTWVLKEGDSTVPPGIGVASDGTVEGRPTSEGKFLLSVEVTDSAGTRAAREVSLTIAKPTQLQIANDRLDTAYLNTDYSQVLSAIGGAGGYVWRVERFQQLQQGPTDLPGQPLTEIPPSFGLSIVANAQGAVYLKGAPTQAGLFAVTLRVRDRNGVEDATTLPLLVSYPSALSITTTALPDAFVTRPYNVRLSHNADSQVTVTFASACVEQISQDLSSWSCAPTDEHQALPPGLFLGADGTITGTPTAPANWDGSSPVVYSFLVKAQDTQGRYDIRGLAIRVQPNYEAKSGCSSAPMGPELFALLGLAGLSLRRRLKKS